MKRFADFNWPEVIKMLGGHLVRQTDKEVEAYLPPGCAGSPGSRFIIISDNGGEVNISKIEPLLDYSVPYTGNRGLVDDLGLACRLNIALRGEQIDYSDPVFWTLPESP